MRRLLQGVGKLTDIEVQRIEVMDTFFIVNYKNTPHNQRKEITYTSVVCTVRPEKEDPNRTRINIGGNHICYPGDVGTPMASLDLFKIIINSVLSQRGYNMSHFTGKKSTSAPPLNRPEYVKIWLANISQ